MHGTRKRMPGGSLHEVSRRHKEKSQILGGIHGTHITFKEVKNQKE